VERRLYEMGKYLFGWGVVTAAYYLTLFVAAQTYIAITGIPIDHERHISGLVLGMVMLVVPYVITIAANERFSMRSSVFQIGSKPALPVRTTPGSGLSSPLPRGVTAAVEKIQVHQVRFSPFGCTPVNLVL
jgi:hypothetical protein